MSQNKVKVTIAGSSYVLVSDEKEEYIEELAQKLDEDISELMSKNNLSVVRAAILSALDYLDMLKKNSEGTDHMRAQIKDYLEDAAKAKMAAEDARREVEYLRKEVQKLRGEDN